MKKKLFSLFTLVLVGILMFAPSFSAVAQVAETSDEIIVSRTVEQLADGYYAEIIITEQAGATPRATTYTKSGSKNYVLRNASGEEQVRFVLHGTFSVTTGVGATCTSATYTSSITNTVWSLESASTSRISNRAMGTAKYVQKVLFVTVDTHTFDGVLSCDANGNLS